MTLSLARRALGRLARLAFAARLGRPLFWALTVAGLLLLSALRAMSSPVAVEPLAASIKAMQPQPADGFFQPERDGDGLWFRWTDGDAVLRGPAMQGGILQLWIGRLNPEVDAATLQLGEHELRLRPAEPRVYHVLLEPSVWPSQRTLNLRSPAFTTSNDPRNHGLVVYGVGWQAQEVWAGWIWPPAILLVLVLLWWLAGWAASWPMLRRRFATPVLATVTPTSASGRPRLDFIDGLRGLAVLLVVISHSWIHTSRYSLGLVDSSLNLGVASVGVNLFMVISGFCLAYPLVMKDSIKPVQVRNFFQRRFIRIVPPYYAALGLFIALPWLAEGLYWLLGLAHATTFHRPDLLTVLSHGGFIHNLLTSSNTLNGSFWSLELELQFYLIFPALILVARRFGVLPMILGVVVLTAVWRALTAAWLSGPGTAQALTIGVAWSGLGRLAEFALGILAAVLLLRYPQRISSVLCFGLAMACIWFAINNVILEYGQFSTWPDIILGLGFFFLLLSAARGLFHRLFMLKPLRWVGTISYSIYLTHEPLIHEMYSWKPGLQGWTAFGVYTASSLLPLIAVGYLFYRLVEEPCLRWGRRIAQRQQKPPAAQAVSTPG
jgi:peptidoglycan/LPS O-acetylase OafA/YrhL